MEKSALMVIDVQVDMFSYPETPVYRSKELLENIRQLIDKAHARSTLVIYIQHTESDEKPMGMGKPGWEIHPYILPEVRDIVVTKYTPDAFHETNLQSELVSRGITKLFITGLQTECCVDTTCRRAILEATRKAYEELGAGSYFIMPEFFLKRAGITEVKPYMIIQPNIPEPKSKKEDPAEYLDIHAGGLETGLMLRDYPGLVDLQLARTLKSSETTLDALRIWTQGGELARKVTPSGYCGNPSDFSIESADEFERKMVETLVGAISINCLDSKQPDGKIILKSDIK